MYPRQVRYVLHSHFGKGRSPETIAERWNRGYPDRQIKVAEVEGILAEYVELREAGEKPGHIAEKIEKKAKQPKLKVAKKAPKRKAK